MSSTTESKVEKVSAEMLSKFKEILKSNGITEPVSEVIMKDSGLRGENMASVTNYIVIKFENPDKPPINLFVKKRSTSESHNEMVGGGRLFEKEAMFFMEYLPMAKAYCKRLGKEELLEIYPKCYYGDKNMIVFENLVVDKGYILLNKMERQDLEAATLAVKNLAKHHALSIAVINDFGGSEKFFAKFPDLGLKSLLLPAVNSWFEAGFASGINIGINVLKKSNTDKAKEAIERLEGFIAQGMEPMLSVLGNDSSNFMVLNHGDYWNNNMMFLKDPKTGKLTTHIAVDFQVIYYGSPAIDLGYFFHTSIKHQVRRKHFVDLLKAYLNALKVITNDLGHSADITLEELYESYCKNFKYGYYIGHFLMSEIGMQTMKDIDINELGDLADFAEKYQKLIQKWMDANPEKCLEYAENTIECLNEYDNFEKRGHQNDILSSK